MRTLDLDSLTFFKAVADTGSVTLAARQLHRVQSNVTTRIKNLEERLGVPLFHRHGNRLTLSSEGQLLRAYAERLLDLSAEAEAALLGHAPTGTLRLGTLESTAAARLPPVLSRFHDRHPELVIELMTGSTDHLLERVHGGEVDAAFVSDPFDAQGLATQAVFDEELVLIAALSAPDVLSVDRLRQHTLIAFPTGCSYRRILESWLASAGVAPRRVLELASYHAIVACVAAGTGIGIMPRSILKAVHAEPRLQVLGLPRRHAHVTTHLVWHPQRHTEGVDALRSLMQSERIGLPPRGRRAAG